MSTSILLIAGACFGLFMLGYFLGLLFKMIENFFTADL